MSDQGPYPGHPGQDPGQQPPQQPPGCPQYPQPGYPPQQPAPYGYGYPPGGPVPGQRPGKLTTAAVVTWIGAGLMLFLFLATLVGGLALPEAELEEALERELDGETLPFSISALQSVLTIVGLVGTAWCAAACVFAGLMLKRQNWARIMLAVSAGATVVFSLISFTAVVPLVFAGAGVAVLVLIFSGEVNAWFRGEATPVPGYPPQQPPQQPPSGSGGPW